LHAVIASDPDLRGARADQVVLLSQTVAQMMRPAGGQELLSHREMQVRGIAARCGTWR